MIRHRAGCCRSGPRLLADLSRCWRWRPSGHVSERRPVVLVVDGLDEADAPADGLPFGLPSLLPDGVYVVATYRTGRAPGRPDAPVTTVRIAKDDQRNQRDIREYLAKAARRGRPGGPAGRSWHGSGGVHQPAGRAVQRSMGLPAVCARTNCVSGCGGRTKSAIFPPTCATTTPTRSAAGGRTPRGTLACFRCWPPWAWPGKHCRQCRWPGWQATSTHVAVQRWCDLTIRPMLTTTRTSNARAPIRYEIYHASFREFLNADYGDSSASSGDQQSI